MRRRSSYSFKVLLMAGVLLLLMGGCPVNTDQLATDIFQAGLESIASSLVDALSAFLAGN
ncbi:MAG: hypothetical protein KKB50_00080 [Planctomycetes bacterium]|nr:hypothetical protein [Planctomycetota bacterium]